MKRVATVIAVAAAAMLARSPAAQAQSKQLTLCSVDVETVAPLFVDARGDRVRAE